MESKIRKNKKTIDDKKYNSLYDIEKGRRYDALNDALEQDNRIRLSDLLAPVIDDPSGLTDPMLRPILENVGARGVEKNWPGVFEGALVGCRHLKNNQPRSSNRSSVRINKGVSTVSNIAEEINWSYVSPDAFDMTCNIANKHTGAESSNEIRTRLFRVIQGASTKLYKAMCDYNGAPTEERIVKKIAENKNAERLDDVLSYLDEPPELSHQTMYLDGLDQESRAINKILAQYNVKPDRRTLSNAIKAQEQYPEYTQELTAYMGNQTIDESEKKSACRYVLQEMNDSKQGMTFLADHNLLPDEFDCEDIVKRGLDLEAAKPLLDHITISSDVLYKSFETLDHKKAKILWNHYSKRVDVGVRAVKKAIVDNCYDRPEELFSFIETAMTWDGIDLGYSNDKTASALFKTLDIGSLRGFKRLTNEVETDYSGQLFEELFAKNASIIAIKHALKNIDLDFTDSSKKTIVDRATEYDYYGSIKDDLLKHTNLTKNELAAYKI